MNRVRKERFGISRGLAPGKERRVVDLFPALLGVIVAGSMVATAAVGAESGPRSDQVVQRQTDKSQSTAAPIAADRHAAAALANLTAGGTDAAEQQRAALDCLCGLDTAGDDFCFQDEWCVNVTACGGDSDCRPGERCLLDNCCGFNACFSDCSENCVGGGTCGNYEECEVTKCVPPGPDCWWTQCDGTTGYDFATDPIPAGFFSDPSAPVQSMEYAGNVTLGGAGTAGGDTVVMRRQQMCFSEPLPDQTRIDIELVALTLKSCNPIRVDYDDQSFQDWDVYVGLPGPQAIGDMWVTKTHRDGGVYSAALPVAAQIQFGPAGSAGPTTPPFPLVLPTTMLLTVEPAPWAQASNFGCQFNSSFGPGWDWDWTCTNPPCLCCKPVCHAGPAPGHDHCVYPPDCTPCPDPGPGTICPLPPPPVVPYCQQLQQTDCDISMGNDFCLPEVVKYNAAGAPEVVQCNCFEEDGCGAVEIVGDTLTCPPFTCPAATPTEICQIIFTDPNSGDQTASGQTSVTASMVPTNAHVTCDCQPLPAVGCPLLDPADSSDPCAALQATYCDTGSDTDVCLPSVIQIGAAQPTVEECACFLDTIDCGAIQLNGTTVSCPGDCPDPPYNPGDICQIVVNQGGTDIWTGKTSEDSSALPSGDARCDCGPPPSVPCNQSDAATCDGACPVDEHCEPVYGVVILGSPDLPPESNPPDCDRIVSMYEGQDVHALFPDGIDFSDPKHKCFENVVRVDVDGDEHETFDSSVEGFADVGSGPQAVMLTGPVTVVTYGKTGNTTGTFDTEIIAMSLSGDLGGTSIEIQVSPSLPSTGQTTITDLGGGQYQIDSFFDVFTELSIDGGPFQPQINRPGRMHLATVDPTGCECVPDEVTCEQSDPTVCDGDCAVAGEVCLPDALGGPCGCEREGACCYDADGVPGEEACVVTTAVDCAALYAGTYHGDGTNCDDLDFDGIADICEPITQFCPLADDRCTNLQTTECTSDNPTNEDCWVSFISVVPGTVPQVENCACFPPDECGPIQFNGTTVICTNPCPDPPNNAGDICQIVVVDTDGTTTWTGLTSANTSQLPQGDAHCDCGPPAAEPEGACCWDADTDGEDETCVITTATLCATAYAGTYHGDGTNCGDFGACCIDDDSDGLPERCVLAHQICCDDIAGGSFAGPNTTCDNVGACCIDDDGDGVADRCEEMPEDCCDALPAALNATFMGLGTDCSDTNGTPGADICEPAEHVCPLPQVEIPWCAMFGLQDTDCQTTSDTTTCWPTELHVFFGPAQPEVIIDACDCLEEGCGGIDIIDPTGTGEWLIRCPGLCDPPAIPCQIHYDDVPQGFTEVPAAAVPPTVLKVSCDCPPELCPLADDLCTPMQALDCEMDNLTDEQCWGSVVTLTSAAVPPELTKCACFPLDVCGPIQLNGTTVSCPIPCQIPGELCQIVVDQVGGATVWTGLTTAEASTLPIGEARCDCAPQTGGLCPLPDDYCAPLQSVDCESDDPSKLCLPKCVRYDITTGSSAVIKCDCADSDDCYIDTSTLNGGGGRPASPASEHCIVDSVGGTVQLPPEGCDYLSPDEVHEIASNLPPGTTIELAAIHKDFICYRNSDNDCSIPLPPDVCEGKDPDSDGDIDCFESTLELTINMVAGPGKPALRGFPKTISMPANCEVHTGPRTPGDAVQDFDTEMVQLSGEITELFGDPDFCTLRVSAGKNFGLPSPGHTTLVRVPGGSYAVDSFFDITYQIDFKGCDGGVLDGLEGSHIAQITMQTSKLPDCTDNVVCPPWKVCKRKFKLNPATHELDICCDCRFKKIKKGPHHNFRKNRILSIDPNNPVGGGLRSSAASAPMAVKVDWLERTCTIGGGPCAYDSDCWECSGGADNGDMCITSDDCEDGTCVDIDTCVTQATHEIGWLGEACQIPEDTQVPADTYASLVVNEMPALQSFPAEVFIADCEMQPRRAYALSATDDGETFSEELLLGTILEPTKNAKKWADVVGNRDAETGEYTAPNLRINVDDVQVMIVFLNSKPYRPHLSVLDLSHEVPSFKINADDLQMVMRAFALTEDYPPLKFQVEASGATIPTECPEDAVGDKHPKCP